MSGTASRTKKRKISINRKGGMKKSVKKWLLCLILLFSTVCVSFGCQSNDTAPDVSDSIGSESVSNTGTGEESDVDSASSSDSSDGSDNSDSSDSSDGSDGSDGSDSSDSSDSSGGSDGSDSSGNSGIELPELPYLVKQANKEK